MWNRRTVLADAFVYDEMITFASFPDGLRAMIEASGLLPYCQEKGNF